MDAARLFVGLPLPPVLRDGLAALRRVLEPLSPVPCAWTRPGEWHLTLKFLGDTPLERIPSLKAALEGVAWEAFTLRPGGAGTFPERGAPRVLWAGLALGGPECAALARAVKQALAPLGFAPEARAFAAHLTVARAKGAAPSAAWRPALEALEAARWEAVRMERMVLWRSYAAGRGAVSVGPVRHGAVGGGGTQGVVPGVGAGSAGGSRPPGPRHVPLWEGGAPG
ncbi:RNA 2',3'-cyclic phosphodiesterase [Fundidesulfovibrio magnetotacticus]|uniref:RNA 2',3'-cyclic phosphodiesterase n=1 Tax=Fundidesulfovibrio magnetotacticus TaxID=2730080 RepID=A0A6V8LXE5_9BACT|nr:RNA 2',3'-cyclic phosphodiesterase [Fundidesulfovibrio magnetotacticus]GFK95251.1 RNA 2',3'-cyclic phosphodiesterase [Fundidesulfovibrio magnetotacticus]